MIDLDERDKAIDEAVENLKQLSDIQLIMRALREIIPDHGDVTSAAIKDELVRRSSTPDELQ